MTEKKKHPGGVPLTYTKELGEEICLKVATHGYGLSRLCAENPHWPCRQTIFEWRIKVKEFGDIYAKAKQEQVEYLVDEMIDIADDTSRDTIVKVNSRTDEEYEVCNTEWINRSRLRVDTRKWLAAQLSPKIYGDNKKDKDTGDAAKELAVLAMKELAEKCMQKN